MKKLIPIIILLFTIKINYAQQVNWISMDEAEKLIETNPKKIMIKLYTDWCGWCKKMDRDTFSKKEIIDYINEKFYAVKLNGEQKKDIVFNNHTFKYKSSGKRGYNQLAAELTQGKLSYPSTSFISEKKELLTTVPGYHKKDDFIKILKYFGDDAYLNKTWEEYNKY